MTIPAGIQTHQKIRLTQEKPHQINCCGYDYDYSDHHIHMNIRVPKKLTSSQQNLTLSYVEDEMNEEGPANHFTHISTEKLSTWKGDQETASSPLHGQGIRHRRIPQQ